MLQLLLNSLYQYIFMYIKNFKQHQQLLFS